MDDWFEDKPAYTGPTTDEMDHTTPEDRYKLVAMCDKGHWHHFTGSRDRSSQTTGEKCSWRPAQPDGKPDMNLVPCNSTKFIGGSLISERTWNPKAKVPKKR